MLSGLSAGGPGSASLSGHACPGTITTNADELNRALSEAVAGSVICLANGIWRDLIVTVAQSGSRYDLITLRAETPGKVFIEGESLLEVRGDYVKITGLYFRNGRPADDSGVIKLYGDHNQLTQTTIDGFNGNRDKKWVSLYGQYADVSYNLFTGKTTAGALLTVWRGDDRPQYHKIRHNHFSNYAYGGGANGWETIRLGTSTHSQSDSYTLIENNLFADCDGEIEIISVKSGKNTLRGNLFVDSRGLLTLRHGKGNTVENNVFLQYGKADGGGIRFYDEGHVIRNNYMAGIQTSLDARGAIVVHSGVNAQGETAVLNAQWTPRDVRVENNTIYLSEQSFVYGGKYKYPAERISFSGNLVYTDFTAPIVRADAALTEASYSSEKYWGADLGFPPVEGIAIEEFSLAPDGQGLYLHATLGAQALQVLKESDVGPSQY
ncbi:polysaccharide lyase 6 family protein [Exilibacterium tricleocarpae]|nr:polysaccharide lyase 6 family protein [Exilibacterium tricleocarpae]